MLEWVRERRGIRKEMGDGQGREREGKSMKQERKEGREEVGARTVKGLWRSKKKVRKWGNGSQEKMGMG